VCHWKQIAYAYTVTSATVLEFDFLSPVRGEVHAIGFDVSASSLSGGYGFQLYGSQVWAAQDFHDYDSFALGWIHYTIPVGQYYTGSFSHLFFGNDDDADRVGEAYFRNVTVYESTNAFAPISPVVVTYPAKDIHQASVTLVGYIPSDGGDHNLEYRFSWWKKGEAEPEPGDQTHHTAWKEKKTYKGRAMLEGDLPENGKPLLEAGVTYNDRAIAGNTHGSDQGGVLQFTTLLGPSNDGGESNNPGQNYPAWLYVDDNAAHDPSPYNPLVSDPHEDGSQEHPFDCIQEAIEAACPGDTVYAREGVYYKTINLMGKNIEVTGFDPGITRLTSFTSYPVVDALDLGTVVTFSQNEDPSCTLAGFVLTGGYDKLAGAISCIGSSPTIQNCVIVGNRCSNAAPGDPSSGAVFCVNSNCVFENCTITGNYGGTNGAALCFIDSYVTVTNSIVWGNLPVQILVESGNDPVIAFSDVQDTWPGLGNIDRDPYFVQSGYWAHPAVPERKLAEPYGPNSFWVQGDYHLKSQRGRSHQRSVYYWLADEVTSPCIDAGNPSTGAGNEPLPSGNIINMGAYGGTNQASKSSHTATKNW